MSAAAAAAAAAAASSSSGRELKKTKNINGEESVASSLNSLVKKQFTNMSEQYNLYASTINKMEEKIKELKNIMLSECFLKNCQNFTLEVPKHTATATASATSNIKRNKTKVATDATDASNHIISDKHDTHSSDAVDNDTCLGSDNNNNNNTDTTKLEYFTPSQSNSLFWCFYIIYNGFASYEYESNYFTAEQQFKIQTIEKVKKGEGKNNLKEHKISKMCFESGLLGCNNINAKTLYALCLCYNLNIFYIYKNTYYEMISNIEKPIHIIKYNAESNNYSICLPVDINATETLKKHSECIEKTKEKYWKLDSLDKPLRAITAYSVQDLTNICYKLDIDIDLNNGETTNTNKNKNKKKTKAELYSSILQKL
jgi:TolA-binding protein